MKLGTIYKATSKTSGKSYIGQTILSLPERIIQHLNQATFPSQKKCSFQNAVIKYGIEDFEFTTLKENVPQPELDEYERYYIKKFKTKVPNGYNETDGGTRHDHSKIKKGVYKIDPNTFNIISFQPSISAMAREVGTSPTRISEVCHRKSYTSKGYIFRFIYDYDSEEIEGFMAQKQYKKATPIISYNINTRRFMNYYPSIYQASIELGISSGNISEFLKGKRDRAGIVNGEPIGFKYYSTVDSKEIREKNHKADIIRNDRLKNRINKMLGEDIK